MSDSLLKILSQELHKPVRKHFPRRKVESTGIDEIWGLDLVDMPADMTEDNDDCGYILTVIDCFSRYSWAVAMKNKTAKTTLSALQSIIEDSGRKPQKLWCDAGKEFVNADMKKFMTKNNIEMYHTYSEHKCAVIERFNRTLKGRMWKYFTLHQTRRWIDILPQLINAYNTSDHRSIGMTPTEASEKENEPQLLRKQNTQKGEEKKPKFAVDDLVRISKVKGIFEKGYEANWSIQVYKIYKVKLSDPVTYYLKDVNGEEIKGCFYEQELQKTKHKGDTQYLVDKIVQRKTVRGKKMCLVKWMGYDATHNSWVPASDIEDI